METCSSGKPEAEEKVADIGPETSFGGVEAIKVMESTVKLLSIGDVSVIMIQCDLWIRIGMFVCVYEYVALSEMEARVYELKEAAISFSFGFLCSWWLGIVWGHSIVKKENKPHK